LPGFRARLRLTDCQPGYASVLKALTSFVFCASLVLLLVSCLQRNQFPDAMPLDPGVLTSPAQWRVDEPAFRVDGNGIE
jgi:hypothetical protein